MADDNIAKLFKTQSVTEIRITEGNTRDEIEKKKEELRQMVGERYRDLIEAADTIAAMNECSKEIRNYCSSLQNFCSNGLKSIPMKESKQDTLMGYMEISSQIKVLMELSGNIWSAVEQGHLIKASYLYKEGNEILNNLHLDGSTSFCPILNWFPVLSQQIQTLDNLHASIKQKCRQQLQDGMSDSWLLVEAVLAIIMLERYSLKSVFNELLNIRADSLSMIFSNEEYQDMPARSKLLHVLNVLLDTITQSYTLFVSRNDGKSDEKSLGLIITVLKQLTMDKINTSDETIIRLKIAELFEESKGWKNFLPNKVIPDHLFCNTTHCDTELSYEDVRGLCKAWIERCKKEIHNGTDEMLEYITTFQDLSAIRDLLDARLKKLYQSEENEDNLFQESSPWLVKCKYLLGEEIDLWSCLFHDLFLNKANNLISVRFDTFLLGGKTILREAVKSFSNGYQNNEEQNLNAFVWVEESKDVLPGTVWNQKSFSQVNDVVSGLETKSLSVSPQHNATYEAFNREMVSILNDFAHYVCLESVNCGEKLCHKTCEFKLESNESLEISSLFQSKCEMSVIKIFDSFDEIVECTFVPVQNKPTMLSDIKLHFALMCKNFCYICPLYKEACTLASQVEKQSMTRSDHWDAITNYFSEKSHLLMKQWSDEVLINLVRVFHNKLNSSMLNDKIFTDTTVWDSVKIEEESETGEQISSVIKIPSSPSLHLVELLNNVCIKINKVGGHSFDKIILYHISSTLFALILQSFEAINNCIIADSIKVSQAWSLQRLFDLKLIHRLLYFDNIDFTTVSAELFIEKEAKTTEGSYLTILDYLESLIDPFDLDVFAPYLTKNVQFCSQRFGILMGLLSPPGKSGLLHSGKKSMQSSSSTHNILPLTTDCGRFSYLPITSRISKSDFNSLPDSIKNQIPLANAFKQITDSEDRRMSQSKIASSLYSKLGALSSSWLSMAGEG